MAHSMKYTDNLSYSTPTRHIAARGQEKAMAGSQRAAASTTVSIESGHVFKYSSIVRLPPNNTGASSPRTAAAVSTTAETSFDCMGVKEERNRLRKGHKHGTKCFGGRTSGRSKRVSISAFSVMERKPRAPA